MKKVSCLIAMLAAVMLFSGCIKSPFESMQGVQVTEATDGTITTQYGPGEYAEAEDNLIAGCRSWIENKQKRQDDLYDQLAGGDKTFALMHRETMSMVKTVFGKGENDPCRPGTNIYDAYIVYAQETGKTDRQVSEDGFGFAKHAASVVGVVKVVGDITGAIGDKIGGDKVSGGRDVTQAGGNIGLEGNTNSVNEVDSTLVQTQVGGENSTIGTAVPENTIEASQEEIISSIQ
jgi:hypothetical protein